MESRTISARPDVAVASTSARVTPTPPRAARFGEVLTNTVVRSAESAMRVLPGSPMMAVAVRGATGPGGALGVPMAPMSGAMSPMSGGAGIDTTGARVTATGSNLSSASGPAAPGTATPGTGVGAGGDGGGIEASLQQSQDMNIYYLRVQETVNAQNRQFTTLSNLLKAEHDTVKTAIGNIR
ncbi:MAG: hypothetical protein KF850_39335 [Labilithrix sp.]|nr:hypothetical protein [Labilithrix sp.]